MPETRALRERAKELRCLYSIHDILRERAQSPVQAFSRIVEVIPSGWQRPDAAGARIEYLGRSYVGPGYCSTSPLLSEPVRVWGIELGRVEVSDTVEVSGTVEVSDTVEASGTVEASDTDVASRVFLPEEIVLLRNIAARLGEYLEWKQTELLGGQPTTALHWQWRERYVEALGASLDPDRFGVQAMYLGGSTETGDARPGSDIDLFLVVDGTAQQREALGTWLEGWGLCLGEVAHRHTGYRFPNGILDVHWLERRPDRHAAAGMREVRLGRGTTPSD